jgi:hypothetical protein
MTSGSEIRKEWPTLDSEGKINRVISLYPRVQGNEKLANTVVKMLDTAILGIAETLPVQPVSPGSTGTNTRQQLKQPVYVPDPARKPSPAAVIHIKPTQEGQDYVEEKWSAKYKRSINCASPKGFSQRAHCAGRKK